VKIRKKPKKDFFTRRGWPAAGQRNCSSGPTVRGEGGGDSDGEEQREGLYSRKKKRNPSAGRNVDAKGGGGKAQYFGV